MKKISEELLRRMQADSGTSPCLEADPRARKCGECGRLLYPEEICGCRECDQDCTCREFTR